MSEILIPTNDYQTPITQELLDKYPKEVQDQLIQYINGSKYINNLISPNRQFARNLPRDANNKIIVDIMNPHILEDMDYFRPTAIHFLKTGRLTDYRPNSNPNSEYAIWLNEEIRRIWYGMVRESDGEWITGLMYFYLNYMPMEITESDEGGSNSGNRVTSFPRVWEGAYLWFHYLHQARYGGKYDHRGGNHAIQVATRGASKSYTCASICGRSFVCGDNEINNTKTLSVIMAALKETLTKDGTLNKFEYCIDHCAKYTEFPNQRLTSTMNDMNWIMGYRLSNSTIKYGTENQTMGVTTNDNAEKARGKRVTYLIYEEIGAFPNFLTAWTTNDASVSDGKVTWGQMIGIGTGGSKGSNFYGVMEMLYNPIGYQVYPLPNYYDLNSTGEGKTVFFFGAYFNREGFYNKDGVSDVVGTILDVLMKRYKIKYNSTDPARLTQSIAERPLTIQEAIMREDASIFPVAQLADVLNTLNTDPTIEQNYYKGRMKVVDGIPDFDPTADVREIDKFPHKDNKLDGCITIYQLPKRGVDNQVFTHRYIAGTDPVDDDGSQTMSLQSTFILDLFTDEIVAEYTGRPLFADDYFEQLRLLLLFYNAQDNYENNKKGLFGHFDKHNSLHLLTDQLPFLKDMDLVRFTGQGNKAKGYHATQGINGYANRLTRNWLLGSHTIYKKDEESDELIPSESQRLYTLKSKAFVEELIQWNTKGNYDRVSAFGALMLLREQRMIDYQGDVKSNVTEKISKNYLGNDDFFSKNFKNYKNSKFRKRPDDGMY